MSKKVGDVNVRKWGLLGDSNSFFWSKAMRRILIVIRLRPNRVFIYLEMEF
jgi:hypothetical protein